VGDRLYGGRQVFVDEGLSSLVAALPGQMLHAFRLGFLHPKTGNPLLFMAEYPEAFKHLVENLSAFRTA
jgi:23S rRNA-/tRNA-specific pseudouridylate synthase